MLALRGGQTGSFPQGYEYKRDGFNPRWRTVDFVNHSFEGAQDVTLQDIGHYESVINFYAYTLDKFAAVETQIADAARKQKEGYFTYSFSRSYDFSPVSFAFGSSTVGGLFIGRVENVAGFMEIRGGVDYSYHDVHTDPMRLRDRVFNDTSDPEAVSRAWRYLSDGTADSYTIDGDWSTYVRIGAYADASLSHYTE